MTQEEFHSQVLELIANATVEEGTEWLSVHVEPNQLHELAASLKAHPELSFDYLFCLTCVDFPTHLQMVYHLTSTKHRLPLVLKAKLNRDQAEIDTICDLWRTAEFHEREVFDLFGVRFNQHPDLRRLIMPDDWDGFPLRKDYEDAVNMIKL